MTFINPPIESKFYENTFDQREIDTLLQKAVRYPRTELCCPSCETDVFKDSEGERGFFKCEKCGKEFRLTIVKSFLNKGVDKVKKM